MGRCVLLFSGYGGGEKRLKGLDEALAGYGPLSRLEAGAGTLRAREAYAAAVRSGGRAQVVGVGAGCVQALMLAQAFSVQALVCALPGADGRRGDMRCRLIAMGNLFAVVAPTLVLEQPPGRLGRRILDCVGARDKRLLTFNGEREAVKTILEHLCRTDATQSLAKEHIFGV